MGLINASGTYVARYTYDAWGNLLSVTNASGTAITSSTHIANRNPLRYRGYYFDSETGFYYLQSRYYDPVQHRFINADVITFTGQGFVGTNMFAYCNNRPVNHEDPSGFIARLTSMHVIDDISSGKTIYESQDDAAFAAGVIVRNETNTSNNEYICGVYRFNSGGYVIGDWYAGDHAGVSREYVEVEAERYSDRTLVAFVHSHPYCTRHVPNDFSLIDEDGNGDLAVAYATGKPIYLAAPNGNLKVMYVLNTHTVTIDDNSYTVIIDYNSYTVRSGLPVDDTIYVCP